MIQIFSKSKQVLAYIKKIYKSFISALFIYIFNMSQFPGSLSITDEKTLANRKFIPTRLELPIFMSKRIRARKYRQAHHEYLQRNKKLYNCRKNQDEHLQDRGKVGQMTSSGGVNDPRRNALLQVKPNDCMKSIQKVERSIYDADSWKLPPNRYDVKDPCCQRVGMKGAYWSIVKRTPQSLPGRFAPPKDRGDLKFYDIPKSITWKVLSNKHKGKFVGDARSRKPYLRNMITDLCFAWHGPNDPGPGTYNINSHTIQQNFQRLKPGKNLQYKISFFEESRSLIHKNVMKNASNPGPGRYEPYQVACPCPRKLIFDPSIWHEIENQKRQKYKRLPYKHIKASLYCPHPEKRNIEGRGHTSLFKSKNTRIANPTKQRKAMVRPDEPKFLSAKYIQMINNPRRKPVSIRQPDEVIEPKPLEIRFNCEQKTITRRTLKINDKIAFLSTTARFPAEDFDDKIIKPRKKKTIFRMPKTAISGQSKDEVSPEKTETEAHENVDGGTDLPGTREPEKLAENATKRKIDNFSKLPGPEFLVKDNEIGEFDPSELYPLSTPSKPEDFFS